MEAIGMPHQDREQTSGVQWTDRFGHERGQIVEFRVLNFVALLEAKTSASATFHICEKSLLGFTYRTIGALDVHHPCTGEMEGLVTIRLPAKYLVGEARMKLANLVVERLGIPTKGLVIRFCPEVDEELTMYPSD